MLITNATLITWGENNKILPDHALYIEGDRIAEIGPSAALRAAHPDAEVLMHAGSTRCPATSARTRTSMARSREAWRSRAMRPKTFLEILERLWWKLDKALTPDDVRYSALVCLVDAVKHGTTTLIDHHASPNAIEGSLDIIADAVDQAGLRACLCYEVTDRDGPERMRAGIDENLRFLKAVKNRPNLAATFGLHASLSLSAETLDAVRAEHDGGFHIHVAEHESDEYDSVRRSGLCVVDRLSRHGILGPTSIAAHCVHIDAREAALIRETGTWVTHQPRSNMNNAVGAVAQIEGLLRSGVRVCLGNDGFSNAMWKNGRPRTCCTRSGIATHAGPAATPSRRWPIPTMPHWPVSSSRPRRSACWRLALLLT